MLPHFRASRDLGRVQGNEILQFRGGVCILRQNLAAALMLPPFQTFAGWPQVRCCSVIQAFRVVVPPLWRSLIP